MSIASENLRNAYNLINQPRDFEVGDLVTRIERNQRLRRLQDQAIHRADRRRLHRALIRNGAIFVIAAVAIFALIWWCGL